MLPNMRARPGNSPAARSIQIGVVLSAACAVTAAVWLTLIQIVPSASSYDPNWYWFPECVCEPNTSYERDEAELNVRNGRLARAQMSVAPPPSPEVEIVLPDFLPGEMPAPERTFGLKWKFTERLTPLLWIFQTGEPAGPRYYRVAPDWPRRAKNKLISGCAEYSFKITETGSTKDVLILRSSDAMFDQFGIDAIEQFKFEPLITRGKTREISGQFIRLVWQIEGELLPDHPACND